MNLKIYVELLLSFYFHSRNQEWGEDPFHVVGTLEDQEMNDQCYGNLKNEDLACQPKNNSHCDLPCFYSVFAEQIVPVRL